MTISQTHAEVAPATEVVDPRPRWRRMLAPVSVTLGIGLGTLYVANVNPGEPGHYPPCPLKFVTGLDCPGCGGLRATHALTQGDIAGAFDHNALFVMLLPVITYLMVRWLMRSWRGRSAAPTERSRMVSQRFTQVLVIALVGFSVLRNIPFLEYLSST